MSGLFVLRKEEGTFINGVDEKTIFLGYDDDDRPCCFFQHVSFLLIYARALPCVAFSSLLSRLSVTTQNFEVILTFT